GLPRLLARLAAGAGRRRCLPGDVPDPGATTSHRSQPRLPGQLAPRHRPPSRTEGQGPRRDTSPARAERPGGAVPARGDAVAGTAWRPGRRVEPATGEVALAPDPLLPGRPHPGRGGRATGLEPAHPAAAVGGGPGGTGPATGRPGRRLVGGAVRGSALRLLCGP